MENVLQKFKYPVIAFFTAHFSLLVPYFSNAKIEWSTGREKIKLDYYCSSKSLHLPVCSASLFIHLLIFWGQGESRAICITVIYDKLVYEELVLSEVQLSP